MPSRVMLGRGGSARNRAQPCASLAEADGGASDTHNRCRHSLSPVDRRRGMRQRVSEFVCLALSLVPELR